jgi:hypothetical protein
MPFDKDTYNLFESYKATFPNTQNHNQPSTLKSIKVLSNKKDEVATKLDVKGQGSDKGLAVNTPVDPREEDEQMGERSQITKFFQYMGNLPDEWATSEDGAIENYLVGNQEDIAADMGVLDDDIPDYEVDWDELYYYAERQIKDLFKRHPQEVAKMFPGLTLEMVMAALNKYMDSEGYDY